MSSVWVLCLRLDDRIRSSRQTQSLNHGGRSLRTIRRCHFGFTRCLLVTLCWLVAQAWIWVPELTAEGTQTGVVMGTVSDPSGQPLPQVTVILNGDQGTLQTTTDGSGAFRFPALKVGVYRAHAELLGIRGAETEVQVFIDRTSEIELILGQESDAAPVADPDTTLQVVAVAPLLDRFETRVQAGVSREFLEHLPVERFYQSVALLLPAVAGGGDGNPNVSGARRANNLFLVDGVDTTDSTTGLFGLNLSYEAVQEVAVTMAALPVDVGRVSGAPINVVTKSGGQGFHGSGRWLGSGGDLTSDYRDPEPTLDLEIDAANSADEGLDHTAAITFSGPLLKDRFWFFAALEEGENQLTRPTLDGNTWNDGATLGTQSLKLTGRLDPGHSWVAQITADDADFTSFSVFDRSPAENRVGGLPRQLSNSFVDRIPGDLSALRDNHQQGDFGRLSWDWVATPNLVVSAAAAVQNRRLETAPTTPGAFTGGAPHVGDNPNIDFAADPVPGEQLSAVFNGITDQGFEERERDQLNVAVASYRRSSRWEHELRLGIDVQQTRSRSRLSFSGPSGIDPATGEPTEGRLFLDADQRDACLFEGVCLAFDPAIGEFQPDVVWNFWRREPTSTELDTLAVYASESLSFGRWLLTLGLRYESVRGSGGGNKLVQDESFAPRIGIKLDPRDDGRTLISATYGRFYEAFPQALLDGFVNPAELSGLTEYQWAGAFGEPCTGQDPADLSSECWQLEDVFPLVPLHLTEPNLSLRRTSMDEITLGVEHQLTPNFDLRVTYVDREWRDLWDDLVELEQDDELGELTFAELQNLPQADRTYEAVMVLLRKRYARRWQLLGSYTWSRAEGNLFEDSGRATFADYQGTTDDNVVNRLGPAPYDRTHQVKLFVGYSLPVGRGGLTLGSALRWETGIPFQQEMDTDFGTRFLTPRGSQRLDDLSQIDLSLGLDWPTTRGFDFLAKLEIFNLTNESTRTGAETDVDSRNPWRPAIPGGPSTSPIPASDDGFSLLVPPRAEARGSRSLVPCGDGSACTV